MCSSEMKWNRITGLVRTRLGLHLYTEANSESYIVSYRKVCFIRCCRIYVCVKWTKVNPSWDPSALALVLSNKLCSLVPPFAIHSVPPNPDTFQYFGNKWSMDCFEHGVFIEMSMFFFCFMKAIGICLLTVHYLSGFILLWKVQQEVSNYQHLLVEKNNQHSQWSLKLSRCHTCLFSPIDVFFKSVH